MRKPAGSKRGISHRVIPWLAIGLAGGLLFVQRFAASAGARNPALTAESFQPHSHFVEDDQGDGAPILQITGCPPAKPDLEARALSSAYGNSQLSGPRELLHAEVFSSLSSVMRFRYGRVQKGGALSYERPDLRAPMRRAFKPGQELAFCPFDAGLPAGWLKRPDGSYMPTVHIEPHAPSPFIGEPSPAAPLAFLIYAARLRREDGTSMTLPRYSRLPAIVNVAAPSGMVRVFGGLLPREAVRLVIPHLRPAQISPKARWIHIDRSEQALSAYEGDRLVFATLVSTGKTAQLASSALYRVFYKSVHDTLHGEPDAALFEEVPFAQYFFRGVSLHGTFWHDDFGSATEQGGIGLSPRDAEWLFGWAPPALSAGSKTALASSDGQAALWVLID